MRRLPALILVTSLVALLLSAAARGTAPLAAPDRGEVFESVVSALRESYFDKAFREGELDDIAARYREAAHNTSTLDEERAVVHEFLGEIPASHLQLISAESHRSMFRALMNEREWMWGFELIEIDGAHYVHSLLEGGPAAAAGLLSGDRVCSLNGVAPHASSLLDERTDDAALPDPPIRSVLVPSASNGETPGTDPGPAVVEPPQLHLLVERQPGVEVELEITAAEFSAFDAARNSIRVIERDGARIGLIHFWFIHMTGPDKLLAKAMKEDFGDCDALILDLRGRGGNALMVAQIIALLEGRKVPWRKPVVALIDDLSRSAKEAIAYEIREREVGRLVGARTAGALLPASFKEVGEGCVLMFPGTRLPKYSDAIEGKGVEPHVAVEPLRMFNNGADPILNAGIEEAVRMIDERGTADHAGGGRDARSKRD